jgi:hypothetical protein
VDWETFIRDSAVRRRERVRYQREAIQKEILAVEDEIARQYTAKNKLAAKLNGLSDKLGIHEKLTLIRIVRGDLRRNDKSFGLSDAKHLVDFALER